MCGGAYCDGECMLFCGRQNGMHSFRLWKIRPITSKLSGQDAHELVRGDVRCTKFGMAKRVSILSKCSVAGAYLSTLF